MALKEKALKRLAEKLAAAGVTWAAGGEWLLCQRGLAQSWHQFDILVAEQDAAAADKALTRLGMKSPVASEHAFRCDYHFDGADIAVYAGLRFGGEALPFGPEDVEESIPVLGVPVPVVRLSTWQRLCALSGQDRTAQAIADHLG